MTLEEILEEVEEDIAHHEAAMDCHEDGCVGWNYHLGRVDSLLKYRRQLEQLELK